MVGCDRSQSAQILTRGWRLKGKSGFPAGSAKNNGLINKRHFKI